MLGNVNVHVQPCKRWATVVFGLVKLWDWDCLFDRGIYLDYDYRSTTYVVGRRWVLQILVLLVAVCCSARATADKCNGRRIRSVASFSRKHLRSWQGCVRPA